jgi:aminopeptidase N
LAYLVLSEETSWTDVAAKQFAQANNMTDQLAALTCLVHTEQVDEAIANRALDSFYEQWQHESLVVNQWLMVQATMPADSALTRVKQLMAHECFSMKNPNKVRSLIGAFCNNNHQNYHAIDGSGYKLLETVVLELDSFNPQIAARMLSPLTKWQKFDETRQVLMKASLSQIVNTEGLSKDVYEVASKSLS